MNRSLLNQRYVPLRKIGSGGMGDVFLARQAGTSGFQREVVLKRIHRRFSEHPRAIQLFLEEARLAAALSHPNIVQIFDIREDKGLYFVVMERVRGTSLRELAETATRQGRMIPMELALCVAAQVLEALRYAHGYHDETGRALHIVHGDVSPTNILIAQDGSVKLTDFGISRAARVAGARSTLPAGKYGYMSPEIVREEPTDARSDLFSVGVLLYELTVGQRLFRASSMAGMRQILQQPVPPPTFARAGYPVDLEIIVMRALDRDPDERFASAEAMLEALEQFAFDTGLRLSRLKLGRFHGQVMGMTARRLLEVEEPPMPPEEEPARPVQEELDFDRGLFVEEVEPEEAPTLMAAREQARERAVEVAEAVREARQAIVDLIGPDDDADDENDRTVEIPAHSQVWLRAQTVPPAEPEPRRVESTQVVTEDQVEEVEELEEESLGLRWPQDEVTAVQKRTEEPTRRQDGGCGTRGDAMRPPPPQPEPPEPRAEVAEPSADLMQALADISDEIRASDALDRQREAAIERVIRERELSLPGVSAPGEHESRALLSRLLARQTEQASAAAAAGMPCSDELESADASGPRPPDALELADHPSVEAAQDGTIELDPGDGAILIEEVEELEEGLDDPTIEDMPARSAVPPPPPSAAAVGAIVEAPKAWRRLQPVDPGGVAERRRPHRRASPAAGRRRPGRGRRRRRRRARRRHPGGEPQRQRRSRNCRRRAQ